GSGAKGTPAYAVYSASKASLFRLADSVVHFGHDKGLRIFEMAPGVVETAMTKSMPVHDFRTGDDWTSPDQVTDLALALASGTLDSFTGRYIRAGADSGESLLAEAAAGLSEKTRRLVLGRALRRAETRWAAGLGPTSTVERLPVVDNYTLFYFESLVLIRGRACVLTF